MARDGHSRGWALSPLDLTKEFAESASWLSSPGYYVNFRWIGFLIAFSHWLPVLYPGKLAAQQQKSTSEYSVARFGTAHGLPVATIRSGLVDHRGLTWLATREGLVRYNGHGFLQVQPTQDIISLHRSDAGAVYALTAENRLLSVQTSQVTPVTAEQVRFIQSTPLCFTAASGLYCSIDNQWKRKSLPPANDSVAGLVAPSGGSWWITKDDYLFVAEDGSEQRFRRTRSEQPAGALIAVVSASGDLAVSSGDSVDVVSAENGKQHLDLPVSGTAVAHLRYDADGTLWAGTDQGLFHATDDSLSLVQPHGAPGSGTVVRSWRGPDHKLWIYDGQQLLKARDPVVTVADGIEDVSFHGELVWVSTYREGVILLRPMPGVLWDKDRGLVSDNVYGVDAAVDSSVWVGSLAGAIHRIGEHGGVDVFGADRGLPGPHPWGVHAQPSGRVLAAPYGYGLYERCKGCENFSEVALPQPNVRVLAMLTHRDQALWLGTRTGLFRSHDEQWHSVAELAKHSVRALAQADDDVVAGTDAGVVMVSASGHARWISSYPRRSVSALFVDSEQRLWIGSHGHGIAIMDARTMDILAQVAPSDALPAASPHAFIEDSDGAIWINSNEGIFRLARQLIESAIDNRDTPLIFQSVGPIGDRELEGNGQVFPAAARDPQDHLWFPTQSGVLQVNPESVFERMPPPVVVVDRIEDASGNRIATGETGVELRHSAQPTTVVLATADFIDPRNLTHRYRVLPDRRWRQTSSMRVETGFSEPGEYVVEIVAANADGKQSSEVLNIPFRVVPSWPWRTIAGLIVGTLTCVLLVIWMRRKAAAGVTPAMTDDRGVKPTVAVPGFPSDPILAPVDRSLDNPEFDVRRWADTVHMSDRQLRRRVKQLTGSTPSKWLRERRLARIHDLIRSGECKTLAEAGHRCGIESPAYLYRIYKTYDPAKRHLDS